MDDDEDEVRAIRETCFFCARRHGGCRCAFGGPGFEWNGVQIINPNVDESGRMFVDPILFYGVDYTAALERGDTTHAVLPSIVKDRDGAVALVRYMVVVLGAGYHPDTPASDYVEDDMQVFGAELAREIEELTSAAFGVTVMLPTDDDIYDIALAAVKAHTDNLQRAALREET